jgi:hypothetical protein
MLLLVAAAAAGSKVHEEAAERRRAVVQAEIKLRRARQQLRECLAEAPGGGPMPSWSRRARHAPSSIPLPGGRSSCHSGWPAAVLSF